MAVDASPVARTGRLTARASWSNDVKNRMERVGGFETFRRRPEGRYLVGPTWIHFCAHRELFGVSLFNRPDRHDIEALTRSLVVELADGISPHGSIVDARRVTGVDAGAFASLSAYVQMNHAALHERVRRLALIRPEGMQGALVAGFFAVHDAPYPIAIFNDVREGLEWLGESPTTFACELDGLVDEATAVSPLLSALRELFTNRIDVSFSDASRMLGLSERTLQRRLRAARTSFRRELSEARLREAERRMLDSDEPLTSIALEVGFSSLQHFAALFRKRTGLAPSIWRGRRRR